MKVEAVRAQDGNVYAVRDQGEYDLWSTAYLNGAQNAQLRVFNYSIGGAPSGWQNVVNADRLDTNLNVANNLVDEEMTIYGIAIQPERFTMAISRGAGAGTDFVLPLADYMALEAGTLFSFYSGGEKPFAEGLITWFPEGGGIYGCTDVNNTEILANGVPTPASARAWRHEIKVRRLEKLWGAFTFEHGALVMAVLIAQQAGGGLTANSRLGVKVRLLGIRARGVQ